MAKDRSYVFLMESFCNTHLILHSLLFFPLLLLETVLGIEPSLSALEAQCLFRSATRSCLLEGTAGFEPAFFSCFEGKCLSTRLRAHS